MSNDLKKSLLEQTLEMQKLGLVKDKGLITRIERADAGFLEKFLSTYRKNKAEKVEELSKTAKSAETAPAAESTSATPESKPAAEPSKA